jgi:hypothetical protein
VRRGPASPSLGQSGEEQVGGGPDDESSGPQPATAGATVELGRQVAQQFFPMPVGQRSRKAPGREPKQPISKTA